MYNKCINFLKKDSLTSWTNGAGIVGMNSSTAPNRVLSLTPTSCKIKQNKKCTLLSDINSEPHMYMKYVCQICALLTLTLTRLVYSSALTLLASFVKAITDLTTQVVLL